MELFDPYVLFPFRGLFQVLDAHWGVLTYLLTYMWQVMDAPTQKLVETKILCFDQLVGARNTQKLVKIHNSQNTQHPTLDTF